MKLKQLQQELEAVSSFHAPKVLLEQYPTQPHLASLFIYAAAAQFDDIAEKVVCDLGVGCGILSIGASHMGAAHIIGIDIDADALQQSVVNIKESEASIDLVQANVKTLLENGNYSRFQCDTVIMNPPFGTKIKGIDATFLEFASKIAKKTIYSLHKTSTRDFIVKKAASFGLQSQVVAELRYDIPAMYKFHKKQSKDIQVDFIRFTFNN